MCNVHPQYTLDNLGVENFNEITLSRTNKEIEAFLHFMQKFKMAAKTGLTVIFVKSHQYTADTLRVEKFDEISHS